MTTMVDQLRERERRQGVLGWGVACKLSTAIAEFSVGKISETKLKGIAIAESKKMVALIDELTNERLVQ